MHAPKSTLPAAASHSAPASSLALGARGDRFEREADLAADQVLSGQARPRLTPLSGTSLQREDDKKKEPPSPIGEGLATVGENLGENNPAFNTFTGQLADRFLAQPAPISVGIPTFLGANYAFLWGMALIDPAMRRSFDDFNLALLPGLVPQFPIKTFQYRILDNAQTRFDFELGLDASKLMTAFNEGVLNTHVSSIKFDAGGKLDTNGPKALALSSMQVQLGLFGDGVMLSGGFRNGISPYPLMGDDGSRVMAQTPALPDLYPDQRDVRFTLNVDLLKLADHFGSPPPAPRMPEQLQRKAADGAAAVAPMPAVRSALTEAGAPLDGATRGFMESRFGHDFSRVRIHADTAAADSARSVHAHAYTVGRDIVFGASRYAPNTSGGQRLLAHELAHVVQQGGTGGLVQCDDDAAARKKEEAEKARARKRLDDWAKTRSPQPPTDPTHKGFAFTAQELANDITHESDKSTLRDKPKDKAAQVAWKTDFRDAYQLALMILDSSGTEQRETRAGLIAIDLATAGFVTEAMAVAARLPAEQQGYIYDEVAKQPEVATAAQLRTVSDFSVTRHKTPADHLLLSRLTDRSGQYATRLGNEKLLAALAPTLAAYKADTDYLEVLAEILVFHKPGRGPVSEWLWKQDKDYLFSVLESPYFVEPGYGGSQFSDAAGTPRVLTMADDMPWVYTYKQKYYVDFLVRLGTEQGVAIPAPKDLGFATLRAWLQAQTGNIGQALMAKYPKDPGAKAAVYQRIADIFFFHVDRGDVVPDLGGAVGGLDQADPNRMRLKADCDVLATYAARLLRGAGFRVVGYLAVVPEGSVPAHAVALLAHAETGGPAKAPAPGSGDERYHIVNNKQVTPSDAADQEAAVKAALADALDIYSGTPKVFRVYYENATATGAMTRDLWTTEARVRRDDLSRTAAPPTP